MKIRVIVLMLVFALCTCCSVGCDFMNPTDTNTDVASVAVVKWRLKDNGTGIAVDGSNDIVFNLFDTASNPNESDNAEDTALFAPGTKGSFDFMVENHSAVSAKYTISFTVDFSNEFKFYSDEIMETEIIAVDGVYTVVSNVEIEAGNKTADRINIFWQWTFNEITDDAHINNDLNNFIANATIVVESIE